MEVMEHELLIDRIRDEYAEQVRDIIYNCQFKGKLYLDIDGLNQKLKTQKILKFEDILTEDDWYEILYQLAPDIYDEFSHGYIAA